jgi:hypothetical protein
LKGFHFFILSNVVAQYLLLCEHLLTFLPFDVQLDAQLLHRVLFVSDDLGRTKVDRMKVVPLIQENGMFVIDSEWLHR